MHNSLTPAETCILTSSIISSIGLDFNLPLIKGIAQNAHLLRHPSEIRTYL